MHSLLKFFSLSFVAFAAASPLESYVYTEDGNEGLRLPMTKKDLTPLAKRASAELTVNNRWWVSFGVGTPPQDLNFLPDTGAYAFTMQSTLMPADETGDAPLYNPSKSSSKNTKAYPGVTYSEFGFSGPVYNETITIGSQSFPRVPVAVWNHAPQAEYGDRTGNLGMGPQLSYGDPPIPNLMGSIGSRLPQKVATMTFNPYTYQGEMDLGFVDKSKYTGILTWQPTLSRTYWFIKVDGMVNSSGKLVTSIAPFKALLDHGGTGMTLPRSALDWYFGKIPGSVFNKDANTYYYPCDADLPDLVFSTGLLPLHLPKESWRGTYVNTTTRTCAPSITVGPTASVYFGDAFLEGVFAAFDYQDFRIGLANRPSLSTNIPVLENAGTTKFCQGTGFSGACKQVDWKSNTCVSLSGTPYFHNVGSFSPSRGYCTLYSDTGCATPLSGAAGVRAPGQTNAGSNGKAAGSFACFWPSDFPVLNSGAIQMCTGNGFYTGSCEFIGWNSYECHNLDSTLSQNTLSIGPTKGYCYLYTNKGCTGAIEDGAPFVWPGRTNAIVGKKVQSFMCL